MQTRSEPVVSTFADATMAIAVFTVGTAACGKRTWAESLPSRFQYLRFAIVCEEVLSADDVDALDRWKEAVNAALKDTPDVLVLCAPNLNPAVLREQES
ncbi:hypothetical protein JKG47_18570 [Acidithiobacillus sp. MC6.1]|nr:hypothetical protein [Acidithiobacillus sp. MC6.1]